MMPNESVPAGGSAAPLISQNCGRVLTILFVVAIVAIGASIYFWRSQQAFVGERVEMRTRAARAEDNFKASRGAVDSVISDLADSLGTLKGFESGPLAVMISKIENTVDTLVAKTHNDIDVRRSQAAMYVQFAATYLAIGSTKLAVDSVRKGTEIFRALAAEQPTNNAVQSDVGLSLGKLSETLRASGDSRGALAADRESLDIARTLADKEPGNKQFRTDVVLALWRLAVAGDNPRERLAEALKLLKYLKLAAMLTPAQEEWIAMIEGDLSKL